MIQILVILIILVSTLTSFYSPVWGWIIFAIPVVIILITAIGSKLKKWKHIPELSQEANEMLQTWGHYYSMPFAGRDFSSASSTMQFAGIILAIIGAFKGFMWGILLAIVNYLLMAFSSAFFNPTNFLTDQNQIAAHEEVIEYIASKQKSTINIS